MKMEKNIIEHLASAAAIMAVMLSWAHVSQAQTPQTSVETTGTIAGHEYVDLGLSVKWATCNVDADSPEQYGTYFAWGETVAKASYDEKNSLTHKKVYSDIGGDNNYDAATANWGSAWRLPSLDEIGELIANCDWQWVEIANDGELSNADKPSADEAPPGGYKITSKKTGASIFLPAAGSYAAEYLISAGAIGGYWSSSPRAEGADSTYGIVFDSGGLGIDYILRHYGLPVRPVAE